MELLVAEAAMATVDDPRTAMEHQDWARVRDRDRDKVDLVASPRIPMELLVAEAVVVPRVATVLLARVKDKDKDKAALAANPRTRMVLLVVAMAMATEDVHRAATELQDPDQDLVADPPTLTDPPPRDLELVALEAVDPVALTTKTM